MNNISHQSYESELVSIIIPAYNSGKYIAAMLDSIFRQTYQQFEIIIAYDDKSTDNTLDIINNYASDNRLIIDTAIDSCLGAARRRGAHFAKGEYIIHIDADDILTPSFLSDLLSVFEQYPHLSVVCGSALSSLESDVENKYNHCISSSIGSSYLYSQEDAIKHWVNWNPIDRHIWVWLIKREFIDENNIYHPLCTYGEDQIFTVQLILNTDEIGYCSRCGYIYISHPTSLMGRQNSPFEKWDGDTVLRKELFSLLSERYPDVDKIVQNQFIWAFIHNLSSLSYSTYLASLNEYGLYTVSSSQFDSFVTRVGKVIYNYSKTGFWVMKKILYSISIHFQPNQ